MTEIEKIEYTKTFIDKLANGINPLNDEFIPDGDIVNNVRLSRCFFYVSSILDQIIQNGGITPAKKVKKTKEEFNLTYEEISRFKFSDKPITRTDIINQINSLGENKDTKKFRRKNLTLWLQSRDLLREVEDPSGKTTVIPTKEGNDMGITLEERDGIRGPYSVIVFDTRAQHYVVDNIDSIISYKEN